MPSKTLLTGFPGSGKTTLIRQVLEELPVPASGFFTREIRKRGVRNGFELVTLDGHSRLLAHIDLKSLHKVGKYKVDISTLDDLAVPAIREGMFTKSLIVVDEIGPMEILSPAFRKAVVDALNSPCLVLGTIVRRSLPFTDAIKARPDLEVIEVSRDNRESLKALLLEKLGESVGK